MKKNFKEYYDQINDVNEQEYEIKKRDFKLFVNPDDLTVSIDDVKNDNVDHNALNDIGVKWSQEHYGYEIKCKNVKELKSVLKLFKVKNLTKYLT